MKKFLSVIVLALICAGSVQSADITWSGSNPGDWATASNWTGGILPGSSDTAKVTSGTATVSGEAGTVNVIYLGGPTTPSLNITNGTLTTVSHLQTCKYVSGNGGNATVNQSGGTFTVGGRAYFAGWANSIFTYNMSAGTFSCGQGAYVGDQGTTATINQTGGTVSMTGVSNQFFRFGWNNSCYGYYIISGGSLKVSGTKMEIKRGAFKVIGSTPDEIRMDGIDLSAGVDASIGITLDSGGSTIIDVGNIYGAVNLTNAKLVVDVASDFEGLIGDTFDVMHAASGITTTGLTLVNANQKYLFSYSVVEDTINGGSILRLRLDNMGLYAQNQNPAEGSVTGFGSGNLGWKLPAAYEQGGTVLCDVLISNAATDPQFTNPQKIVNKQNVEQASYVFNPDITYLWRVDCYSYLNGVEQKTTGVVWSFHTMKAAVKSLEWTFENTSTANLSYEQAIPGSKIKAAANSYYSSSTTQNYPENTINGWGMLGNVHSAQPSGIGMWMTDGNFAEVQCPGCATVGSAWIKYEFDQPYSLGTLWIWNHNQDSGSLDSLMRGIQNATIEYSTDGVTYTTLGSYVFGDATHFGGYEHNTEINFNGITAKYVVITAAMTDGSYGSLYRGLSEVRFGIKNTTAVETSTPDTGGNTAKRGIYNKNPIPQAGYIYDSGHCLRFDDGDDYVYSILTAGTDFPLAGDSQWSMNMYVYFERAQENGVVVGGFGDVDDGTDGCKRLIVVKNDCIKFWGDSRDIETSIKWDLAKWQMITATYDGTTLRLYKNGSLIGSAPLVFVNAAGMVQIASRTGVSVLANFEGKMDDFAVYNGVLTQSQIDSLAARLPIAADLNRDRTVNYKDLALAASDWLQGATAASDVNTSGITPWTESFEDGTNFQSRWTVTDSNWIGWSVTANGGTIPNGAFCLTGTSSPKTINRSIGSISGNVEISWYYRIASTTGTGYDYVLIRDADGDSLATFQMNHDSTNGYVTCYRTGNRTYTFPVGDQYVKITARINRDKGRLAWFVNGKLVEKNLCMRESDSGEASRVSLTHNNAEPAVFYDLITVGVPTQSVDFPDSDISGPDGVPDGFVDFYDFAEIASNWKMIIE
jgi:hypothetical protein